MRKANPKNGSSRQRFRMGAVCCGALAMTGLATGCSQQVATCAEYAELAPGTGLLEGPNDAQIDALRVSLEAAGYDGRDTWNISIGSTEVVAYCNIYDGVAGSNRDLPISNAH